MKSRPSASMVVTTYLGGRALNCLVDTGSTHTLMSYEAYQRIASDARPELFPIRGVFTGVNGRPLEMYGTFEGVLVFGQTMVKQTLVVAAI